VFNTPPVVSVIVPVYNHERFLHQRIDTILNQTFRDYEVIILDDCSDDKSFEIAQSYLWHPAISVVQNEINNGSPFRQWQKGIEMAKGKIIWIAEGDDASDHLFLHTLLPAFKNSLTALAYCSSHVIDEYGEILENHYSKNGHYENIGFISDRWLNDYTDRGINEITKALAVRNTIPNVSAVLFRKKSLLDVDWRLADDLQTAGDWFVYVSILKTSDIFYSSKSLNYHRKHRKSVVAHNKNSADLTIPDYFKMHMHIIKQFKIDDSLINLMINSVTQQLRSLWPDLSDSEFKKLYDENEIRYVHNNSKIMNKQKEIK
jgi:glycosyltransferase involved in cell wall biosynthesis